MKSLKSLAMGLASMLAVGALAQQASHSPAFRSMEQKIAFLNANAARSRPDPKPVEITESEANAYFNEGGVKLPKGVSNVRLAALPGQIEGRAQVDFEQITQRRGQSNPLYG